MNSKTEEVLSLLSLEEKLTLLTGAGSMETAGVERLGIQAKKMADGPHGVRTNYEKNCTAFPNLCLVGATWDKELIYEMGVDMILGPGVNIKRHMLCGRNFEYISEDPVLAGEIAAAYINGLQSLGVGASLKHYAANNQEKYRITSSVDADIRTLMEIYLKAFEIAIKKSSPASVRCAYNKIHSIWCSENKFLLTEVLRDTWGYEGFVVSDWGAVHNSPRAFKAGLDLQMPQNEIKEVMLKALENGEITMVEIDRAVAKIIDFLIKRPQKNIAYDRNEQHKIARQVAATGTVLLKNKDNVSVDVHNPDYTLKIEIRDKFSYIYGMEIKGAGGYPVGVAGKGLLMLSGGIDSPVAGYLAMKRGVKLECLYFESPPHTSEMAKNKVLQLVEKLSVYQPDIRLHVVNFTDMQESIYKNINPTYMITIMRRMMYRISEKLMKKRNCLVLVNGESIGQVASQTLPSICVINNVTNVPVIRPVACLDKLEIIDIAKKIDTYDTSILPYEDCCTIFLPKHPVINPKLDSCIEYENNFNYNELIDAIIDNIETININDKKEKYDF